MSRTGLKKEKYDTGNELPGESCIEGTAARTRPLSFTEIMLRRKNKKLSDDAKEGYGEPEKLLEKSNVENVSDCLGSDGSDRHGKDPVLAATTRALKDVQKGSPKKKEEKEKTTMKKVDTGKGKDKEIQDLDGDLKDKSNKHLGGATSGGKNDKRKYRGSQNDKGLRDDSDDEFRKNYRDRFGKDKFIHKNREKSVKESKRRHRNEDDERNRSEIDGGVKKHDLSKLHESETSERSGRRKESSRSHYEEVRPKRRRSRSREQDRDKRSFSLSPRAHKRTSHGREHEQSSFHSSRDKSGRQHTDVDRHKMSSNGGYASSQYRRHGGYSSGIGGYSPRKRKTDAAVKTPSPTNRSPERRSAGWDRPPSRKDSVAAGSTLNVFPSSQQAVSSNAHEKPSAVPVTSTAARPLSGTSSNAILVTMNDAIESIQLTQATRPMRRLYVENLPALASEKDLMEYFNSSLVLSGVNRKQGTQPCISCMINKEKSQALVEFLTADDASTATSFDGRLFSNSILKVRRPKDYVEAATGVPEKSVAAVNTVSDVVKDSPHKIFVGGISKALSANMVMEIASAFGLLKAYHFQVDEYLDESCAFLEYVDQSITLKACAGLNGMKLGGQVLTVVQATPDASVEGQYSQENMEKPPSYGIPEHAKPLLERPTPVLKLTNMFNPEDLQSLSALELDEVLEDIRLECSRFGTVKSVNFVKDNSSSAPDSEAFESINNSNIRVASANPKDDDETRKAETSDEDVDHDAVRKGKSESPSNVTEYPVDGVAEGNGTSEDKPVHNFTGDGLSEKSEIDVGMASEEPSCPMNIDGTRESPNQLASTKDQLTCHNDGDSEISQAQDSGVENSIVVADELRVEPTDSKLLQSSTELHSSPGQEPGGGDDRGDIFEPGCVLVEYVRTEASCMAAHCLHGRLFGDRVVDVSFVAHDVYVARFPK